MTFLLDTDTCSAIVKRPNRFAHRMGQYAGRLAISGVTLGELMVWVHLRSDVINSRRVLEEHLLSEVEVLPFGKSCAEAFGALRVQMQKSGTGIGAYDLQIAATTIAHGLTLVTHNTRHFDVVPGLPLEDWVTG